MPEVDFIKMSFNLFSIQNGDTNFILWLDNKKLFNWNIKEIFKEILNIKDLKEFHGA